ncbi:hypothetical protein [Natronosalvus rutilus]|uniref:Uncharacterized protein n=1 Tax=Natronosalvus rutilus TaxID=2953753 RepID=A0A9E7N950_9EURY|nr:hypothetical protein [Natronosalvus rutilus]UTF52550.1 hypothetical protein NGM29_12210 [Natronosalvus rutilus]
MLDPITGSPVLMVLAALVVLFVVVAAVRFAIKMAIRIGLVAAVVLAGLYTVGYLDVLPF